MNSILKLIEFEKWTKGSAGKVWSFKHRLLNFVRELQSTIYIPDQKFYRKPNDYDDFYVEQNSFGFFLVLVAFDGRKHTKTQAKEHHAEPEMFIVSIRHGKKRSKNLDEKKVFQRRRKSNKRKIEHFQSIKFFIFFYPSPALSSLLFSFLTRISEEQGMQSSLMCSAKKLLHCCTQRWKGENDKLNRTDDFLLPSFE